MRHLLAIALLVVGCGDSDIPLVDAARELATNYCATHTAEQFSVCVPEVYGAFCGDRDQCCVGNVRDRDLFERCFQDLRDECAELFGLESLPCR